MSEWRIRIERAQGRYSDAMSRSVTGGREREAQLVRAANAAWGAGLSLLMTDSREKASRWFSKAATAYRDSYEGAPKDSWGRPIGAIKARVLGGDWPSACRDALWTLELGARDSGSAIGRYAAALALLVLGDDSDAAALARALRDEPEGAFPGDVAEALLALAERDAERYGSGLAQTLRSFERRARHLEGIPVADTVLVLEALAEKRSMARRPRSELLPSGGAVKR